MVSWKYLVKVEAGLRICVIDKYPLSVEGMSLILRQMEGVTDIQTLTEPLAALEFLHYHPDIDLVIVDLFMPDMDGEQFVRSLQQSELDIAVITMSATQDMVRLKSVLDLGVMGVIPKWSERDQLFDALKQVMAGEIYIPEVMRPQLRRLTRNPLRPLDSNINALGVTRRQRDVLKLVAKGHSNREISLMLNLTEHTIKSHLSAIYTLIGAKNRADCLQKAYRLGLLKLPVT